MRYRKLRHIIENGARSDLREDEVGAVQHRDQLLTAIARDEIERPTPSRAPHRLRDVSQTMISGLMTVAIVIGFEVIEIDHDDGELHLVAHRLVPDPTNLILECGAIEQPGEPIV